jgi:hypothetical protein
LEAAEQVRGVVNRLSDFSALLPRLGELAMDSQKENIEESRSPEGVPFIPLAESTIAQRGSGHPYGDKPLLDTTNMYQSIHYEVRSADAVFAGPSMEQADYFPFVTSGRRVARQFIGLRAEDRQEISDVVSEWIVEVLQ